MVVGLEGEDDECFNPSIGILVVQTGRLAVGILERPLVSIPQSGFWLFRLGDGVRILLRRTAFQSLNRDSGCSDEPVRCERGDDLAVSIPQSGFWLFRLERINRGGRATGAFQSLNRDSGCSDCE